MPATSKSQQKLFALVHLYQQGKLPADKVSAKIKRVAKTISPEDVKKYASTKHTGLKEIVQSSTYITETLNDIVENKTPEHIKGVLVDHYTASLLKAVITNLNESNKEKFISKSVNEMVAIAYKMVTT